MESKVALLLTEKFFSNSNGRLYIIYLVSNNDSTIHSLLTHYSENVIGLFPEHMSSPIFLADPSHHVKFIAESAYSKATDTKDSDKCKKHDENRLKNK